MQKITVQPDFAKSLTDLSQKVLLCDDTGKELGFFQPALKTRVESPLTLEEIEELRRRYIPGTGRTTEEVLRKWES